ncbi:MAG: AAA family ATPase [Magnetococcus sp. YQC-5]
MIFQEIEICNLFSYHGNVIFDLAGHTAERPIVLISGRNGFGKTSFLNSIKLLFNGPGEDLRNEVSVGRKLSPKAYMLGHGEDWMGVFNRLSRAKKGNANNYFVRCQWREKEGTVSVKREWFPDGEFDPSGRLTIFSTHLDNPLNGVDAQQFLEKRLPPTYLSFFFFDGEKFQVLAEANSEQLEKHIEGILNIAPVIELVKYLDTIKKNWAKEGAVDEEQRKFNQINRDLEALHDQLAAMESLRANHREELEALDEACANLERRMRDMRGFQAQEDEVRLQADLRQVQENLAKLRDEVVDRFIPEAPVLVNPGLMQELLSRLEQDDKDLWSKKELLGYLRNYLPLQVFERPIPSEYLMKKEQKNFFKDRLHSALDNQLVHEDVKPGKHSVTLEPDRQNSLRRLLIRLEGTPIHDHARRLQEVSRLARRAVELRQKLEDISTVIDVDRVRYRQMQEELKRLRQQRDELIKGLAGLDKDYQVKQRELDRKQIELNEQENKIAKAGKYNDRRQKSEDLIALFQEYKNLLRQHRRESVEREINRFFKILMTSHDLINHITIDENFGRHFHDQAGNLLGGANFSEGMKQLAAIALLWALKEVSGIIVPVIVDTPLARIDRKNQENLLREYFPHAAEQVIILPTDSELDRDKYRLLADHIYREFQLDNPRGDRTRVESRPMYQE